MKFLLKEPCRDCPFRNDKGNPFFAHGQRVEDILDGMDGRVFPCHKTADFDDDGNQVVRDNSQACAGALIMMKKAGVYSAAVQILGRLGVADLSNLNMDAPTYASPKSCVQEHDKFGARVYGPLYAQRRRDIKRGFEKWWWQK